MRTFLVLYKKRKYFTKASHPQLEAVKKKLSLDVNISCFESILFPGKYNYFTKVWGRTRPVAHSNIPLKRKPTLFMDSDVNKTYD